MELKGRCYCGSELKASREIHGMRGVWKIWCAECGAAHVGGDSLLGAMEGYRRKYADEYEEAGKMAEKELCKHCTDGDVDAYGVERYQLIKTVDGFGMLQLKATNGRYFLRGSSREDARIYYCPICGRELEKDTR